MRSPDEAKRVEAERDQGCQLAPIGRDELAPDAPRKRLYVSLWNKAAIAVIERAAVRCSSC